MPNIQYTTMTSSLATAHNSAVVSMMTQLYAEDHAPAHLNPSRFPITIDTFLTRPDTGRVILFFDPTMPATPCGYALLVPYYSNEFAGIILFIDELYVLPSHRNQGIARDFLSLLKNDRPFHAVALALEVSRTNSRARKLYESLGFEERPNALLALNLP